MRRWEKRLSDLAHLLSVCGSTYFDPDIFRLNTNQFLTTARTVTFLIQKDKAEIPFFEKWYSAHVLEQWVNDPLMTWAKDSRNHIEKEGDLDVHSQLSVTLIYSYVEENDISILCSRDELVAANIKRLMKFAEKELPSGIADMSVLKIERRWVANTLPDSELLSALIYIYSRVRVVAVALAKHLGTELAKEIPSTTAFDDLVSGSRKIKYIKFNDRRVISYAANSVEKDSNYKAPVWLSKLVAIKPADMLFDCLKDRVTFLATFAEGTFHQFGNHIPILHLFGGNGELIDSLSMIPDDQATKFIFWRAVAERIVYLRVKSLVWVTEVWVRKMDKSYSTTVSKMPITGEMLQVVGLESNGNMETVLWQIERTTPDAKPSLSLTSKIKASEEDQAFNYLKPVRRAFEKLYSENN